MLLVFSLLALSLMPASVSVTAEGPEHVVSGAARDLAGVAMTNVVVQAQRVDNGSAYTAVTAEGGLYTIELPDGLYNVSAMIDGYSSNITYAMLMVAADIESVDFTIQVVTGGVEGHVTSGESPIVGAQVVLSNGNSTYLGTTSFPLGGYSIAGVVPGVFVARAEMLGYWTNVSQLPVYVSGNQVTDLDFVLDPQPARIFGKVTVDGNPEEGVSARLMLGTEEVRVAVTDAHGNYSFSNIIAGEYQVVFSKEGLVEKTYPISISPFEDKELSISMETAPASGNSGFIDGLDLTHSMMVVALIVVMLLMAFAIIVRMQVMKRPELLAKEDEEKEEEPPKKADKR